jgi:hypothetical protein
MHCWGTWSHIHIAQLRGCNWDTWSHHIHEKREKVGHFINKLCYFLGKGKVPAFSIRDVYIQPALLYITINCIITERVKIKWNKDYMWHQIQSSVWNRHPFLTKLKKIHGKTTSMEWHAYIILPPFQNVGRFGKSISISFVMHLDKHYV